LSSKPLDDLLQIVRNGGSLELHMAGLSGADLVQLVRNARANSTITLRGAAARTTSELIHIAGNAVGNVILDIT
jgi:hypothetical protein